MATSEFWQTEEDWHRVEAPLLQLDLTLSEFAAQHGLRLTKNHRHWPERSIEWGQNVQRLIQIYLINEVDLTFNIWLCASQDRDGKRYWNQENIVTAKQVTEFQSSFSALLNQGMVRLESWGADQLKYATELASSDS